MRRKRTKLTVVVFIGKRVETNLNLRLLQREAIEFPNVDGDRIPRSFFFLPHFSSKTDASGGRQKVREILQ